MEPPTDSTTYAAKDQTTPPQQHHLGDKINIATRSAHTKLNKSLLLRLPLAIPPKACTPSVYVSGLIHVASIYIAFESSWMDIITNSTTKGDKKHHQDETLLGPECCRQEQEGGASSCYNQDHKNSLGNGDEDPLSHNTTASSSSDRILSVLSYLRLPVLERSPSLRADIRCITGWSEDVVDEQIARAAERGGLGEFVAHIRRSVDQRPHVLLAYAWVLYMALFSGGRFIRGSLENAGPEFWSTTSDPVLPGVVVCRKPIPCSASSSPGAGGEVGGDEEGMGTTAATPQQPSSNTPLQFFRFATPQDGEDLKTEFKRRLVESESRLTLEEQQDIVQEATCIFDHMNNLVTQLDCVFASSSSASSDHTHSSQCTSTSVSTSSAPSYVSSISSSLESWARLLIPGGGASGPRGRPLKDSVAIAKERMKGASRANKGERSSGGSYSSVTSSDWEAGRSAGASIHSSIAAGSVGGDPCNGAATLPCVSILQTKRPTTNSPADVMDKNAVFAPSSAPAALDSSFLDKQKQSQKQGAGDDAGGADARLARSKSVRFGTDVHDNSAAAGGIVRTGAIHDKLRKRSHPSAKGDGSGAQIGGLDGADDGYELDDEYDDEVGSSVVIVEPHGPSLGGGGEVELLSCLVGEKERQTEVEKGMEEKHEKHVRFVTPDVDHPRSGSVPMSSAASFSSAPVKTLWNGLVFLGVVGVVVGVGRFRG